MPNMNTFPLPITAAVNNLGHYMKYASTAIDGDKEKIVMILPLEQVPAFDPENPHPQTYGVDDDVQIGWIKDADGSFKPNNKG